LVSDRACILASAAAFGLAHLVLWNPLAVGLSALGGWMFASTYLRTRSLPAVCWEHALYGVALFTIGFGRYFVTGWLR
jgi:membrane protease YdiL (CAAX protease family)